MSSSYFLILRHFNYVFCGILNIYVWILQVLKVALATNNAVVADGANITVAGLRVTVTSLSGYSALHTGNIVYIIIICLSSSSLLLSFYDHHHHHHHSSLL